MKTGIMTIYRSGNYGATLQAYATKQAIIENGFGEAEIINYCPDAIKQKIDGKFIKKVGLFHTAVACVEKVYYHPRMKGVNAFIDSFAPKGLLKKDELGALNEKYDVFLSGSDQIWNYEIAQGDQSYLLDFVTNNSKKRSYASSFGTRKIAAEYEDTYKRLLSQYKIITVREKAGAELVAELTGREARIVLDPTLLLTTEQWEAKLPEPKFKRDFVFAYQMAHSPLIAKAISKARKKFNSGAVFVPFPIMGVCKCRPSLSLSSLEWARAIHDSKFVITDSFHGAVFAIIFKKQFYYMVTSDTVKRRLSRLETLLDSLGISDRIIDDVEKCNFNDEIDYEAVHEKLDALREQSLKILKEVVSNDNE